MPDGIFHAVAHPEHVDALAIDRALMKKVFLPAVVPYEPEPLIRAQRLDFGKREIARKPAALGHAVNDLGGEAPGEFRMFRHVGRRRARSLS